MIYQVLSASFASISKRPRIMEMGVHSGKNAIRMHELLAPAEMVLVDSWSSAIFDDYMKSNGHRSWIVDPSNFSSYFGGPLNEQSTFDRLLDECHGRFAGLPNIRFIRSDTRAAAASIKTEDGALGSFDLIYVDANHQYETVLDDLLEYQDLLSADGCFQLNDCCHSVEGVKQNLGVLEAAVKFCKMADFVPVLLTNTDFTDVLLVKRGSKMKELIDRIVTMNDVSFVELPPQLLGALVVRSGRRSNLSFI